MRTFVVGDIHGCHEPLLELLTQVEFDYENDRLISMGDLCDRGSTTWEVIELLLKVKNKVLVKGNHDPWLETWLRSPGTRQDVWLYNGGRTTLASYDKHKNENYAEHLALLRSQVYYHIENNICFVHGGFDKNHLLKDHDPESLMWDRELVMQSMSAKKNKLVTKDGFDLIFVGHTPTLYWDESVPGKGIQPIYKPIFSGGVWNIDTGCGKGGHLTLFDLNNMTYIQSEKKYYNES